MTKVMFQVGLLGFFVSALYFGTQGMPLMDMVLRSFIVFIAIVVGQAVLFVVLATMKSKPQNVPSKSRTEHHDTAPAAEPQAQQAATQS
jgi:hypothetical protein